MMQSRSVWHFLRPGLLNSTEITTLGKLDVTFNGLLWSAHTLVHRPKAVVELLEQVGTPKRFLVDPRTYAFAQAPELIRNKGAQDLKVSWRKLADKYGISPNGLPLKADDVRASLLTLATRVVAFQQSCIQSPQQLNFFSEPYEHQPLGIVAPYFRIFSAKDEWAPINVSLVRAASQVNRGQPVWAVLFIDKGILSTPNEVDDLAEMFSNQPVEGFLLWVDGFAEWDATPREVFGLKKLVGQLNKGTTPVLNMYGGYLSILLSHCGMAGVSHSFDSGEKRKATPVKGGRPEVRYYIPPLHRRFDVEMAEDYFTRLGIETWDKFAPLVCNCQICQWVMEKGLDGFARSYGAKELKNGKVQGTEVARGLAALHFLISRHAEIVQVSGKRWGALMEDLKIAASTYRDPLEDELPSKSLRTSHLRSWSSGLSAEDWIDD